MGKGIQGKIRDAGFKTLIITLTVLIGASALIFFVSDNIAGKKAEELGNVSGLNWVIPLGDYEYIEHLQNGAGLFVVMESRLFGVIAANGDLIIPCKYEYIAGGSEAGLIRAALQGKVGYVDERGEAAIPFIYDEAFDFCGGYALVSSEGRYHVIDIDGETVYENRERYQMHPTEKEGIFSFWTGKSLDEEWGADNRKAYKGLIDARTGDVLVNPDTYQDIFHYSESFWLTSLYPENSTRRGMSVSVFLDENWNEAFPDIVFHEARPFSEGFAAVSIIQGASDRENLPDAIRVGWGYIDTAGKMLESDLYLDSNSPFKEGLAAAFDANRLFFIDTSGKEVFEVKRTGNFIMDKESFQEGLAPVATESSKSSGFSMTRFTWRLGTNWGYVNKSGNFVIPPIFQDASPVVGGLAVVQYADTYGVISVPSAN